jgi:protein tyrosine/serine phosphatase
MSRGRWVDCDSKCGHGGTVKAFLSALALAFSAATTVFAATAVRAAVPIKNFAQVGPGIYRGGRPAGQQAVDFLQRYRIKTVINLQGGDIEDPVLGWAVPYWEAGETPQEIQDEAKMLKASGMRYIHAPLNSLGQVDQQSATRIGLVVDLLASTNAQPIYIHCAHGADRTGLVVALYRMKYGGWSLSRAHQEMVERGHDFIHILFTWALDEFLISQARFSVDPGH